MQPFRMFRKHQKIMMVVLLLLILIAFTLGDTLRYLQSSNSGMPTSLSVLLLAICGAAVAGAVGLTRANATQFAMVGAIVGAAFGLVGSQFSGAGSAVEMSIGGLSQQQVTTLENRRRDANRFVDLAYMEANPIFYQLMDNPQFRPMIEQQLAVVRFQHTRRPIKEDVVIGHLLRHEANKMGIVVDDNMVQNHILRISNSELTNEDFKTLLDRMNIKEAYLYSILKDELQASIARRLVAPRLVPPLQAPRPVRTPEQYWQDFRKMNVSQSLQYTEIKVNEFADLEEDPGPTALEDFYQQYKDEFPKLDGTPGFKQPRRVRLAYVEATYDNIKKLVADEITDEKIKEHYEENKDIFYRKDTLPFGPSTPNGPVELGFGTDTTKDDTTKDDTTKDDTTKDDTTKKDATKKDGEDAKSDGQPTKNSEASKKVDQKKPTEAKKDPKSPAKSESESKKESATKAEKKESSAASSDDKKEANSPCDDDDKKADDKKADDKKADDKKADDKKADDKKADDKKADDKKADDKKADDKKADDKKADDKNDDDKKTDDKEPPSPKYKPLNDELKDEIRQELLGDRTREVMQERIDLAITEMQDLASQRTDEFGDEEKTPKEIHKLMKAFAKKHDMQYTETEFLSYTELEESEHPIGKAVKPSDSPFGIGASESIADLVFSVRDNDANMYIAEQAKDPFLFNNLFAYWIIENRKSHVHKSLGEPFGRDLQEKRRASGLTQKKLAGSAGMDVLEIKEMEEGPEEGPWRIPAEAVVVRLAKIIGTTSDELLSAAWRLRDEVSEAQKQELARPKAKELAERLADKVRIQLKNGKTMTEVIKQETTTADDEPLVVKTTLDFTWLTRRFTPQRFGQQPQGPPVFFSSVPGLGVQTENNDFMETVFGMKLGDVGIVANADKSIYYVVRIAERTPSDEDGRAANRETFFDQNVFGNQQYQFLAAGDAITSLNQWTEQFLEKYEVKFKEDADGDDS